MVVTTSILINYASITVIVHPIFTTCILIPSWANHIWLWWTSTTIRRLTVFGRWIWTTATVRATRRIRRITAWTLTLTVLLCGLSFCFFLSFLFFRFFFRLFLFFYCSYSVLIRFYKVSDFLFRTLLLHFPYKRCLFPFGLSAIIHRVLFLVLFNCSLSLILSISFSVLSVKVLSYSSLNTFCISDITEWYFFVYFLNHIFWFFIISMFLWNRLQKSKFYFLLVIFLVKSVSIFSISVMAVSIFFCNSCSW